jgi:DNA (cytosine-5)-methyltransferase 1
MAKSVCPTIRAQTGKHQGGHSDRPILCREELELGRMRETDGFSPRLDSRRGRLIGNSVSPAIAEWIARRILSIEERVGKTHAMPPLSDAYAISVTGRD